MVNSSFALVFVPLMCHSLHERRCVCAGQPVTFKCSAGSVRLFAAISKSRRLTIPPFVPSRVHLVRGERIGPLPVPTYT
jgi:hypothetical protein